MSPDRPASPLLTVKQMIPPVRAGAVPRDRLVDLLRGSPTPFTVVVAPAGWGKTSLLSSWAADSAEHTRVAWVSLDAGDDEPTRFWSYVLTALRRAGDEIGPAALDALAAPGVGPLDLALPILLNELAGASASYVLVLDDYHVLTDPRIHEGVEFLVSYLPSSARVVVAGRSDPPLPLARMRARGELTEVRAADLRFTFDEAAALVSAVSGTVLDREGAAGVWERTEGWAAGLQLAGLALRADPARPRVRGDDRHLLDYFTAEVLPALAPEQRDLLRRAAPLERLSGALCDAALGVSGSAGVLDALDRADLFVVSLDAERTWYRCHHLLRDVLRGSDPDPVRDREVLCRAAAWFSEHDRIDDAVRHLLGAGDTAAAAALLEASEAWFWANGSAATYLMLGEEVPDPLVGPQLALSLAYAAAIGGRPDRVVPWPDIGDARIAPDSVVKGWRSARAAAVVMRATLGVPDSEPARAVALAQEALDLEAAVGNPGHRTGLAALGSALARDARFDEAAGMLRDSWRQRDRGEWSTGVSLDLAGRLGLCLLELGQDAEAGDLLGEAAPLADEVERAWGAAAAPVVATVRVVEGRHRYREGDATGARDLLARAVTLSEVGGRASALVLALVFLADAELACGDRAAAGAALARAREVADEEPTVPFVVERLGQAEARIGRVAVAAASRSGELVEVLTDREMSILRTLAGSATQREIGAALFLSVNTVKAYNRSLYRKLGVSSRQDAVRTARRLGLI
ncbi:helix-turn-helix transcriptional regulator [Pseudonocardia ailaonensis]